MLRGIYLLIIQIDSDVVLKIGALGAVSFSRGTYVYVGSAQTNLEHRVKRHLRKDKRLFWHVDYLLNSEAAEVVEVLFMPDGRAAECATAKEVGGRGDPVEGFGCSDCRCVSHLFRLSDYSFLKKRMKQLTLKP